MMYAGLLIRRLFSSELQREVKKTRRLVNKLDETVLTPALEKKTIVAFCTAESYDLAGLAAASPFSQSFLRHRNVLHFRHHESRPVDVFFFRHGSFVLWSHHQGAEAPDPDILAKVKAAIKPFEQSPLAESKQENEEIPFRYSLHMRNGSG
jgi:uncharacterized Rmd1/YagE family protein